MSLPSPGRSAREPGLTRLAGQAWGSACLPPKGPGAGASTRVPPPAWGLAVIPGLDISEAADIVYALLSPDLHRILTVERGWDAGRYQRWIARSLSSLLPTGHRPPASPNSKSPVPA